jgi:hypothetical protein
MRQLQATQYVELMVRVVFSAWMFTFRQGSTIHPRRTAASSSPRCKRDAAESCASSDPMLAAKLRFRSRASPKPLPRSTMAAGPRDSGIASRGEFE